MTVATELQHRGRARFTAATSTLHLFFMENVKSGLHLMQQLERANILPLPAEVGDLAWIVGLCPSRDDLELRSS